MKKIEKQKRGGEGRKRRGVSDTKNEKKRHRNRKAE